MLAVFVAVIGALYVAREVLIPLALAMLLSFALAPVVTLLRRTRIGRIPSVFAAVLLTFVVVLGIGSLFATQVSQLADALPHYQANLIDKVRSVQNMGAQKGIVGRASGVLKALGTEIDGAASTGDRSTKNKAARVSSAPKGPMLVEIHQPEATPLTIIQSVISPLIEPLAMTGMVIVFVILFLLQREDLRDRFIRLVGADDLKRTTEALNDAVGRLSRYLLMQTMINTMFGGIIGCGLWLIGIPNALLWGILAMVLRFVPYIGPIIAALFPMCLALAVDPGWSMVLWTGALFLTIEPIIGQIVEPLLYGKSTGLSAVAIVVSAACWTWLWGPIGLLLSTPLTLCLVVVGRHVTRLEFLDVILGDRPALSPEENFYQRLLAGDPDEAAHQAEIFLKEKPLSAYYDEVGLRGLFLAQRDVRRGELEHERRIRIREAALGLMDNLSDYAAPEASGDDNADKDPRPESAQAVDDIVLCIAGRGVLDETAASMLAQLLGKGKISGRVVPAPEASAVNIFRLDIKDAKAACLSYLDCGDFANTRYLVRRLRRRRPDLKIMVALWGLDDANGDRQLALRETEADCIVSSLSEAVIQLKTLLCPLEAPLTATPAQRAELVSSAPIQLSAIMESLEQNQLAASAAS